VSGLETKQAPSASEAASTALRRRETGDIRFAQPYLLVRSPVRAFVRRLMSIATLVVIDLSGLAFGIYAALVLRDIYRGNSPPLWGVLWRQVTDWLPFLAVVTVLIFWQAGLYAPRERRAGFGRVVFGLVVVLAIAVAFGVGIGKLEFRTFGFFPTALVLTVALVGLLRASYDVISADLLRAVGVRRRVVLVGAEDTLEKLHSGLGSRRNGIDYDFLGAVSRSDANVGSLPALGTFADLPQILDGAGVGEVIVSDQGLSEEELMEIAESAHRAGAKVRVAPKTTELLLQRAEYIPGQGVPLFELRPPILAGADWIVKRSFDIVVSLAIVVLGLPLWLAIAAAIKLNSRGSVFYRDCRVGLRHKEFTMLKFRTMVAGAEEQRAELESANEADGALFKIRDDPRITGVGAFLRRLSLDEVPQVLNVLRGEMSLVGPRPLPIRDYHRLEDWQRKRELVLPGMTGLWQISGRSALGVDDLVRLDFYYIENWSLWLDISILAKTLPAVLASRGAY
jgi:exopolysaccharide biosynthesis polyprenyl glycosylphosphotransferase